MIHEQVDARAAAKVKPLQLRLDELTKMIETKRAAFEHEDSKKREAQLREEVKAHRSEQHKLWGEVESIKTDVFRELLVEEYGVAQTHPKFNQAYSIAYSHGHSSGYSDIENYFSELVDLIK